MLNDQLLQMYSDNVISSSQIAAPVISYTWASPRPCSSLKTAGHLPDFVPLTGPRPVEHRLTANLR